LLYGILSRKDRATNAQEFNENFQMCLKSDQPTSKYFLEWREKLNKEMEIFKGKAASDKGDAETASTMSGATGITGINSKANSNKAMVV